MIRTQEHNQNKNKMIQNPNMGAENDTHAHTTFWAI